MFSDISDNELDNLVRDFMSRHGATTDESFISSYFRSKNYHIQRSRVRASIDRVDLSKTASIDRVDPSKTASIDRVDPSKTASIDCVDPSKTASIDRVDHLSTIY